MDITSLSVAFFLIVLLVANGARNRRASDLAVEAAQRMLRQAHRRAQGKYTELLNQTDVASNAWASLLDDPSFTKSMAVMLEIKMIEQVRRRADAVFEELALIPQCTSRKSADELRGYRAKVWKHIPVLNVCMSDVKDSVVRLRCLTTHLATESFDQPFIAQPDAETGNPFRSRA
jgi:hypothetical protein